MSDSRHFDEWSAKQLSPLWRPLEPAQLAQMFLWTTQHGPSNCWSGTSGTAIGSKVTIDGKAGVVVGRENVVAYDALKRPQGPNILVQFDNLAKWINEPSQ